MTTTSSVVLVATHASKNWRENNTQQYTYLLKTLCCCDAEPTLPMENDQDLWDNDTDLWDDPEECEIQTSQEPTPVSSPRNTPSQDDDVRQHIDDAHMQEIVAMLNQLKQQQRAQDATITQKHGEYVINTVGTSSSYDGRRQ